MKKSLSYSESLIHLYAQKDSMVTIGGIGTFEISHEQSLSKNNFKNALYRTIAQNTRLSTLIIKQKLVFQAHTLRELRPSFQISEIDGQLTKDEIKEYAQQSINMTFDPENELGWSIHFYYTKPTKLESRYHSTLFLQISMLHCLTDGHGAMFIADMFIKNLQLELDTHEPLDLDTQINTTHCDHVEQHISMVDASVGHLYGFWVFAYIWRVLVGFYIIGLGLIGFVLPIKSTYSGIFV